MSDNRRLDALFAERVLGHKLKEHDGDLFVRETGDGLRITFLLPLYTQSLDAAWAGVEKIEEWVYVDFDLLSSCGEWMCNGSRGATPALALVKACLLAVGVTQEEIDASR